MAGFFPKPPAEVFAKGQEQRVPLLIGNNSRERTPPQVTDEELSKAVDAMYGPFASRAFAMYTSIRAGSVVWSCARAVGGGHDVSLPGGGSVELARRGRKCRLRISVRSGRAGKGSRGCDARSGSRVRLRQSECELRRARSRHLRRDAAVLDQLREDRRSQRRGSAEMAEVRCGCAWISSSSRTTVQWRARACVGLFAISTSRTPNV